MVFKHLEKKNPVWMCNGFSSGFQCASVFETETSTVFLFLNLQYIIKYSGFSII